MEENLIAMVTEEMTRDEVKDLKEMHKEARSKVSKKTAPAPKEEIIQEETFDKLKTPAELRAMPIPKREKYFEWMRQRDKEKVKGIFRNFESPGNYLEFPYRAYKGEGTQVIHMQDGETYEIERGIERHLNTNCWYPQYEHLPGGKFINVPGEQPTNMRVGRKVRRFAFQVIDAGYDYDASEALSPILFVEHVSQQNITSR